MAGVKKALGRGLDALIPRPGRGDDRGAVRELPVAAIRPNPHQPRRRFLRAELGELAQSIREHGLLQPLTVRPAAGGYELVTGERRLLAAQEVGLAAVPCIVRDVPDNLLLPLALIENIQREDLGAVEQAHAFKRLNAEFGLSHDAIARAVAKSRAAVSNCIRLLDLPGPIMEMLERGDLNAGQARPLVGIASRSQQLTLARRIARQGLNARQAEALANAAPKPKRPAKRRAAANPYADALARRLEDRLGTKVEITGTASRGAIKIHYFSATDLERLTDLLASPATG